MKAKLLPHIFEGAFLALAMLMVTDTQIQAQSPDDVNRAQPPSFPIFAPFPSADLPGKLYGVDLTGGFLKFTQPGRAELVVDGRSAMYDMAILQGSAYYISSSGYLYRSNLLGFAPVKIGYSGRFNAMDFSPSGKLYAMGARSTMLYQIDLETGAATEVMDTGYSTAGDICFVAENVFLLTSSDNKLVKVDMRKASKPSKELLKLKEGKWYSMDYRKGQIHLIDNSSGQYLVLLYPGLSVASKANIYRNSEISGFNGISFH